MNTLFQILTKLVLTGLLSFTFTSAYPGIIQKISKTEKNDSLSQLQIEGRIVINNKHDRYKIEVLVYDQVVQSFNVKNNKPINLRLKKNTPYVLRVSKKGYVPRLICLNTNLCEDKRKSGDYTFYFETELIEVKQAMCLDNEALQLPIALIAFDKKTGEFNNNKDYTAFVNQKIYGVN